MDNKNGRIGFGIVERDFEGVVVTTRSTTRISWSLLVTVPKLVLKF